METSELGQLLEIIKAQAIIASENNESIKQLRAENARGNAELRAENARGNAELRAGLADLEKNVNAFITESRMKFGQNERQVAEMYLHMSNTQNEIRALATNVGRLVEALNNKGNI